MFSVRGVGATALCAVLTLAACGGGDDDDGAAPADTEAASGETFKVSSSDAFKFNPSQAEFKAGTIHVEHDNEGGTLHTFVIEGTDFKLTDDDEGDVDLAAGDYVFYCDVPGHREAGMEGDLTVTP